MKNTTSPVTANVNLWVNKDSEWVQVNNKPMTKSDANIMLNDYKKSGITYTSLELRPNLN